MTSSVTNPVRALALITLGLVIAAMGVYVAEADDAPGAAVMGFLLMAAGVWLGVRAARNRLPAWAGRTALVVGLLVATFSAFLTHAVVVAAPLFSKEPGVPSVSEAAVVTRFAAAVERARQLVHAAVVDQNLPGVSAAVGVDGYLVWAEGFGWRDVETKTPVTPKTRFVVGTASRVIYAAAIAGAGMSDTGSEPPEEWCPDHVGEPEEDFPLFRLVHDVVLRPLGLADPAQPLPDERATFYVPRSKDGDPRRGRRLMFMRDLGCGAGGMAFYSTPTDLVRFAPATKAGSFDGELAGGAVVSVSARPKSGIFVAVASNVAHADTRALAEQLADAFAASR